MPLLRDYPVFVSHAWAYGDEYLRVVNMLHAAPFFSWTNLSVPEHNPIYARNTEKLKALLRDQMRPASVFLILGGMYVAHSDWIDFEINFAWQIGRPIIGIRPWGSQRIPDVVSRASREIVGWNTGSIVDAIRRNALTESM